MEILISDSTQILIKLILPRLDQNIIQFFIASILLHFICIWNKKFSIWVHWLFINICKYYTFYRFYFLLLCTKFFLIYFFCYIFNSLFLAAIMWISLSEIMSMSCSSSWSFLKESREGQSWIPPKWFHSCSPAFPTALCTSCKIKALKISDIYSGNTIY